MMTEERRQNLMKEYKKYLIDCIENLEDNITHYRELLEDKNKEIEHLKSVHQIHIEAIKEDAYSKFLVSNREYLERFVKEFILENLTVEPETDGSWIKTVVYVSNERGESSTSERITFDD